MSNGVRVLPCVTRYSARDCAIDHLYPSLLSLFLLDTIGTSHPFPCSRCRKMVSYRSVRPLLNLPARQFAGLTTPKMGERGRGEWAPLPAPALAIKSIALVFRQTTSVADDGDRKSCSLFLLLLRRRRKYWIRKQNQSRGHALYCWAGSITGNRKL